MCMPEMKCENLKYLNNNTSVLIHLCLDEEDSRPCVPFCLYRASGRAFVLKFIAVKGIMRSLGVMSF